MDELRAEEIRIAGLQTRVVGRCTSTNALLLAEKGPGSILLAAEEQTAGRGRRGRRWRSTRGAGATFSILRRMRCAPAALAGLSLAMGVACVRALRALGVGDACLKWPNDLVVGGKDGYAKLGGILIQTRPQDDDTVAVIGIGINCRSDPALQRSLGRKIAALDERLRPSPTRNALIVAIGREVQAALHAFERGGLAPFAAEWSALHAHEGARVQVRLADGRTLSGRAHGIAYNGALRLRTARGTREIVAGRVVRVLTAVPA